MTQYVATLERVLLLRDRIEAIEKNQAERFPMLVQKLDELEKRIKYLERAERRTRYIKI